MKTGHLESYPLISISGSCSGSSIQGTCSLLEAVLSRAQPSNVTSRKGLAVVYAYHYGHTFPPLQQTKNLKIDNEKRRETTTMRFENSYKVGNLYIFDCDLTPVICFNINRSKRLPARSSRSLSFHELQA